MLSLKILRLWKSYLCQNFQAYIPLFASISHKVQRHLFAGSKTISSDIHNDSFKCIEIRKT